MNVSSMSCALLVALAVVVNVASGSGSCVQVGAGPPQCNQNGYFKPKQCNDAICWCVERRGGQHKQWRGRPVPFYVPLNHPYNCKRRPRRCLRDWNDLRDIPSAKLPDCDKKGRYIPKQCDVISGAQCGDTTTCGAHGQIGFSASDAALLDHYVEHTMVLNAPVGENTHITGFEAFVGATGRPLLIGVYRPTGTSCQFVLEQQIEWTAPSLGYNKVELAAVDRLRVHPGDYVGISWTEQGVVKYDNVASDNYCEDSASFSVGDTATLVSNRHGKREYSILFLFESRRTFGFPPLPAVSIDTSSTWTMVDKHAVTADGTIIGFEVFVGAVGRDLFIGVYSPTATDCKFTLEQQTVWTSTNLGYNKVELDIGERLSVLDGYRVGFSWNEQGVVKYSASAVDNYCEDSQVFSEGDTATLVSNRFGFRRYSIRFLFDAQMTSTSHDQYLGDDPVNRAKLDTAQEWTMVNKDAFAADVQVKAIEVFAGATGRPLLVGLYRPTAGVSCRFTLVKQIAISSFSLGFNRVDLVARGDVIDAQAGDCIGFTWENYGVVDYDDTVAQHYCEKQQKYNEGDVDTLNMIYGDRLYSFRVVFSSSSSCNIITSTCEECYCVDKKGVEQTGTRTTGNLVCD